ncbi:MAG: hypothetical protein ACJA1U_002097 [Bermanella sp.]|jgi:hypothetical protein
MGDKCVLKGHIKIGHKGVYCAAYLLFRPRECYVCSIGTLVIPDQN